MQHRFKLLTNDDEDITHFWRRKIMAFSHIPRMLHCKLMTMSPLHPCSKPCSRALLTEAPSSSQKAQGNKRLIVISLVALQLYSTQDLIYLGTIYRSILLELCCVINFKELLFVISRLVNSTIFLFVLHGLRVLLSMITGVFYSVTQPCTGAQ